MRNKYAMKRVNLNQDNDLAIEEIMSCYRLCLENVKEFLNTAKSFLG